mgnify:CR=1 FL=1
MDIPVDTTGLGFAQGVCWEAAFYFEKMDARDASHTIVRLWENQMLWKSFVAKPRDRV